MFNACLPERISFIWILNSMGHMIPTLRLSHVKMLLETDTSVRLTCPFSASDYSRV